MSIAVSPPAHDRPTRTREPHGGPAPDHLPVEVAFLREYGTAAATLVNAARVARRHGVGAAEALLAGGEVTDALFYKSLAHLVDAPFRLDLPTLAASPDVLGGLRRGWLPLADGTCLLAPTGEALRLLLEAAPCPDLMPRRLAITTPAHLERLALQRAGGTVARRAALALPTLAPALSARHAGDARAAGATLFTTLAALVLFVAAPATLAAFAGGVFLAAVVFRWAVCFFGLSDVPAAPEPRRLPDRELPTYSVLVALRHEAGMVPGLLRHLAALDYPAAKLEILLLVEADDASTLAALRRATMPAWFRVVSVPPGAPRTKPRALNVGLALARGALITVYDAEDRPDPDQLRRAASRYAVAPAALACLQARLAITVGAGLLPRLFALEYAGLFDLYNPGLARLGLPVPLGGTSNHFRASALRAVGGWDAWNVTEDADLGLRLARFGYGVEMLASSTLEEAPARLGVWMRQRRRWTKGWMQVALVLARDPSARRDLGAARAVAAALMLVNLVLGPLATVPVLGLALWQLWGGTLVPWQGSAALALVVPATAVAATLWCGWAGLRRRRLHRFACCLPLLLPYQVLIACAAWGGLWDLVRRPYHWRKTPHGAAALSRSSRGGRRRRRRERRPPPQD